MPLLALFHSMMSLPSMALPTAGPPTAAHAILDDMVWATSAVPSSIQMLWKAPRATLW